MTRSLRGRIQLAFLALLGVAASAQAQTLTASENTPIRALDPAAGETGLAMQRFRVDADAGSIELESVTVAEQGTAQIADIATVRVYIDVDLDFDGSVQVGSAPFDALTTTVNLTGGTAADRAVTNPAPKYLWIVYDLAAGAIAGRTLQSRATTVAVVPPDTGATGLTFDSNLLTIIEAAQNDTTVLGSTAFVSSCSASGGSTGQITVISAFTGDDNDDGSVEVIYDTSPPTGSQVACAAGTGPSPRQCLVSGLAAGTYDLTVTFSDPDNGGPISPSEDLNGNVVNTCGGTDTAAPTVLILSPWRDAIIGGPETVRVQVWDGGGALAAGDLLWAVDAGTLVNTGVGVNGTYDCGTDCGIFEFALDTTTVNGGLTDDRHTLVIQVTDGASNVARVEQAFRVRNLGVTAGGSGQLLRRTPGSRLCLDCHDLPTHSSQNTSTRYGNWAMACNDCHTPHGTTNIFLMREEVRTPSSGRRSVRFEGRSGAVDVTVDLPGAASFVNEDAGTAGDPAAVDGPCQVCHTRTQAGDGKERWRNFDQPVPNADNHFDFGRPTETCTECHSHVGGFKGAGGCAGCHFGPTAKAVVEGGRRDVEQDFSKRSHHVGSGGVIGGTLTDFDCVVCHAEGTVDASGDAVTTADYHNDNDCSGSPCIDLKDVDNWDNLDPPNSPVFRYDKQRLIDQLSGGTPGATPGAWGSGDTDWEDETSQALDPFCLTCHDFDGATASRNADTTADTCTTPDPLNPFCDTRITNSYDQTVRGGQCSVTTTTSCHVDADCPGGETCDGGRVTDIASRVANAWRTGPSGAYTATDRDVSGEARFDEAPSGADGIDDPPLGVYSRHAIRGVDLSTIDPTLTGFSGAASVYASATDANGDIPAAFWTSATWEDNVVMGCADCHTTDGANHTSGNAHGSDSEYLLKAFDGTATLGVADLSTNPDTLTANCYRCHSNTRYGTGNAYDSEHTGNTSDWADTAGVDFPNRVVNGDDSTIYGIACTNCHGGVESGDGATDGPFEFGTIHGTSQTFGIGVRGGSGSRQAYRFMNGNSLRYYDPQGWAGAAAVACYTIDSGDPDERDAFGTCTHHNSSGQDFGKAGKPVQRDLKY